MKLVTFVGTGKYCVVNYKFTDSFQYETKFFVQAAAKCYEPSEILVLLTPDAKGGNNWSELKPILEKDFKLTPIDIKNGSSEEELWEIFDVLTGCLDEGDEVIFDVTHSFRSLPILTLLAATFLRVAKSVKLKKVIYGAYEPNRDIAPVFDLTPFITLLDWVTATDKFIKSGDGAELSDFLHKAQDELWRASEDKKKSALPRRLKPLGTNLKSLSKALLLIRPKGIAKHAKFLKENLQSVQEETEAWVKPFSVLLGKVQQEYEHFAQDSLSAQRELIIWYTKKGHLVQAISLMREWIVSYALSRMGKQGVTREEREEVEKAINQLCIVRRVKEVEKKSEFYYSLEQLPSANNIIELWDNTVELRNDVAHCGFRENPKSPEAIEKQVLKVVELLKGFSID